MPFLISVIWSVFHLIQASLLVNYRFGSNFGQIFFDYSGSGNHGQNGISINSNTYDTIPFDRGAYFHTESTYIRLPPNQVKTSPHYWMNSFSIIMWTYFKEVGYDYYVFISRFNDTEWFQIIRKFDYDRFHTSFYNRGTLTDQVSTVYDTASPGKWICISMIVDNLLVKCYSNDILFANFNLPLNYIETNANYHLIGSNSKSLIGFVWSFYLYDEVVLPTNFYSTSYTGSNCVSTGCPSSCSPAIKENDQNYCISTSDYTSCSGCSYGCKNGICLNCENSFTKSCTVESNEIYHICPESTSLSPCNCVNGYYLINNYYTCKSCYGECSTCNSAFQCSTCKDGNSEVHSDIGCYCKQGFYNTSALISSGICMICHSDCLECTMENICISCKSDYSTPDLTTGCMCNEGYYNTTNLSESSSCLKCYSTCKSCKDFQKCLTCTPSNSSPRSDYGCECNQGYYNSTSLETGGICLKCHSDCEICDKDLLCLTCKDLNSQPDSISGCACKKGFYNTSELNSISYCKPCSLECNTCTSEFICNECADSNSIIIMTGGCLCKDGFYNTSQIVSQGSCLECHHECKTCNESFKCLTCLDANSIVSPQPGCVCKEKYCKDSNNYCELCNNSVPTELCTPNAEFNGTDCICLPGYYNSSSNSELLCKKCPNFEQDPSQNYNECNKCRKYCTTCKNEYLCELCDIENFEILRYQGCKCPENLSLINSECVCSQGKVMNEYEPERFECLDCHYSCKNCKDTTKYGCLECFDYFEKNNTDNSCNSCIPGYYLIGNNCEKCDTENCYQNMTDRIFTGYSFVDNSNILWIVFNESLLYDLNGSNMIVHVDDKNINYEIIKTNEKISYGIEPSLDNIFTNCLIEVEIISKILSQNYSILLTHHYSGTIKFDKNDLIEREFKEEAKDQERIASRVTSAGLMFTFGVSIAIYDLSSVFNFINTAEMIYSVYLLDLKLNPIYREFILGMRLQKSSPNIFKYFIPEKSGVKLSKKLKKYGYKTNLLMINGGIMLTTLGVAFGVMLIFSPSFLIPSLRAKVSSITNWIYTNFILKLWIQSFFEITVVSSVAAKYNYNSTEFQIIDGAVFFVIVIYQLLMTFYLIYLIKTRYSMADSASLECFDNKYKVFFNNLKNESRKDSFFYLIFLTKRIILAISSQTELSGLAQLTIMIISGFLVLFYLLYTRCFKITYINIFHILTESFLLCINLLLLIWNCKGTLYESRLISDLCIKCVYVCWGLNFLYSLLQLSVKLLEKFKEILNYIRKKRIMNQISSETVQTKKNKEEKKEKIEVYSID